MRKITGAPISHPTRPAFIYLKACCRRPTNPWSYVTERWNAQFLSEWNKVQVLSTGAQTFPKVTFYPQTYLNTFRGPVLCCCCVVFHRNLFNPLEELPKKYLFCWYSHITATTTTYPKHVFLLCLLSPHFFSFHLATQSYFLMHLKVNAVICMLPSEYFNVHTISWF